MSDLCVFCVYRQGLLERMPVITTKRMETAERATNGEVEELLTETVQPGRASFAVVTKAEDDLLGLLSDVPSTNTTGATAFPSASHPPNSNAINDLLGMLDGSSNGNVIFYTSWLKNHSVGMSPRLCHEDVT